MLEPALATDPQFLERFRAEARTVAGISHPNVVVVHDWGEDDDTAYLVSEYLAGGSLRGMLHAGSTLTPSQALVVGLDVCRGLAHAHKQGLVHRDLKPANLLFDPEGRLRIADFGLARAIAEAAITEPDGALLGTARYAAPEQARGQRLDGKADVYALAVTLVEAVTGSAPFAGDTTLGTLMARTESDLPVPEALGPLRGAVQAAGRLDPDERPDAEEFGLALLAASERLSAPTPLPLVGALVEAALDEPEERDDHTQTMVAPVAEATAVDDATTKAKKPKKGPKQGAADRNGVASPVDLPVDEEERRRRRWPWAILAVLLVALGAGGYFAWSAIQTPSYLVPENIEGQNISDIELLAEQNGWELDVKKSRRNGTDVGQIMSTTPAPGERLEEGSLLTVIVSEGNELTDTPTGIEGKPVAEVEAAFDEANLVLAPQEEFHEEVPADHAIGYQSPPEARLPQESELVVLVSKGPAPRTVPSLPGGTTYADYAAALEAEQLVPKRVDEFSDTVPKDVIIATSHEAGAQVARGSEITIRVSKGPDVVPVPDVIGMSFAEAKAKIESVGLKVGDANRDDGTVTATEPGVDTPIKRGEKVDLLLRK